MTVPRALVFVAAVVIAAWARPLSLDAQGASVLFDTDQILAVTLTADFAALDRDRRESPDRPGTLTLEDEQGGEIRVALDVRTRGAFRLDPSNCSFPPLRLDISARSAEGTVFRGLDDLKLVSSCRPGRDEYDQLVVLEYLAYRAYRAVTDQALRVRPLRVTLVNADGAPVGEPRFAFLIEEDEDLAGRLGATVFELEEGRNLPETAFDPMMATTIGVFEYMVGNTDWSLIAGHNVELFDRGGVAAAAPYDFDFSGLVDAPYATPTAESGLRSVTERWYRGWCTTPMIHTLVLTRFRAARAEISALFADYPELDEPHRLKAVSYLGTFFDDIESDERAQRRFLRDCRQRAP